MRPKYLKKPIGSIKALAATLNVSESILTNLASTIERHYTPYSIPKSNGKQRTIQIPSSFLKIIQKRINRQIFENVSYPHYLYGGVEGKDYVKNAVAHSKAYVLIALDAKDFYPSIRNDVVFDVYKNFCKFHPDVADLLTRLTTLRGCLPQGACTSSHLANLALHDVEYHSASHFESMGYTYTRLLDDICISSPKPLSEEKIEGLITEVAVFLKKKNLKLHSKKKRVTSRKNPKDLMFVTGLWLNRGKPRISAEEREIIRATVHRCIEESKRDRSTDEFHELHGSVSGKIAKLSYLNYPEAKRYRKALKDILPIYSKSEITKTKKYVRVLLRSPLSYRERLSYAEQYYKTQYRVTIVARTDKEEAKRMQNLLRLCRPAASKKDLINAESI